MTNDDVRLWAKDTMAMLVEQARDAKRAHDAAQSPSDKDVALGRLMAFHDVVSLLVQQADAFAIPRKDVGLDGVEPERDLL